MAIELVPVPPTPKPSRRIIMQTPVFAFSETQRAELADELDTGDDAETSRIIDRIGQHCWLYRERRARGARDDRRTRARRAWLSRLDRQAVKILNVIRERIDDDQVPLPAPLEPASRRAVADLRTALRAFLERPADDAPDPRIDHPYELPLVCAIADVLDSEGWPIAKGAASPMPAVLTIVLTAVGRGRVTPAVVHRLVDDAKNYLDAWRAQSVDLQFSPTLRLMRNLPTS